MNTRAIIGLVNSDNSVISTSVNFDGYVAQTGMNLIKWYNSIELVSALINRGQIHVLRETIDLSEFYPNSSPVSFPSVASFGASEYDYKYLFDSDTWYCDMHNFGTFDTLLASLDKTVHSISYYGGEIYKPISSCVISFVANVPGASYRVVGTSSWTSCNTPMRVDYGSTLEFEFSSITGCVTPDNLVVSDIVDNMQFHVNYSEILYKVTLNVTNPLDDTWPGHENLSYAMISIAGQETWGKELIVKPGMHEFEFSPVEAYRTPTNKSYNIQADTTIDVKYNGRNYIIGITCNIAAGRYNGTSYNPDGTLNRADIGWNSFNPIMWQYANFGYTFVYEFMPVAGYVTPAPITIGPLSGHVYDFMVNAVYEEAWYNIIFDCNVSATARDINGGTAFAIPGSISVKPGTYTFEFVGPADLTPVSNRTVVVSNADVTVTITYNAQWVLTQDDQVFTAPYAGEYEIYVIGGGGGGGSTAAHSSGTNMGSYVRWGHSGAGGGGGSGGMQTLIESMNIGDTITATTIGDGGLGAIGHAGNDGTSSSPYKYGNSPDHYGQPGSATIITLWDGRSISVNGGNAGAKGTSGNPYDPAWTPQPGIGGNGGAGGLPNGVAGGKGTGFYLTTSGGSVYCSNPNAYGIGGHVSPIGTYGDGGGGPIPAGTHFFDFMTLRYNGKPGAVIIKLKSLT